MSGRTRRLTLAQALVEFLANQHSERDGREQRLFAGCFGIFGHGNVAGVGQALQQYADRLRYYQARNEQGMVHAAAGYARQRNRLATFACTTSIGPGATNLVTGAATANDCLLPVSRYWDRINRPEQLPGSLLEAMRVLTDPAETDPAAYVTIGGAWWDVAVAEVATSEPVREARAGYERNRQTQRPYL
jgi:3D-(3,5/4)-trihydroxycyclohexane-1,2-dione acylhydrolase (decyclizing)